MVARVKTHLKISKKNLHIGSDCQFGTQEKRFSLAPFFGSSCLLGNRVRLKSGSIFCFQSICTMANQLLLCLSILHLLPHQLDSTRFENSSALDHVVVEGFQYGSDIQDDESSINLSVIMTNMASEEAKAPESMFTHLDLYLSSLLSPQPLQQKTKFFSPADHHIRCNSCGPPQITSENVNQHRTISQSSELICSG